MKYRVLVTGVLLAAVVAILSFDIPVLAQTRKPAPTPAPAKASTPTPPVGDLRVAQSGFGKEQMDPTQETDNTGITTILPMYDSLVGAGFNGKTAPGIAERWETSANGLTWTFFIRKGVKFHNGDPLTAEDVKFSLERAIAPEGLSAYAVRLRKLIKGIKIVDPYTMEVNLTAVSPYFDYDLSPLISNVGFVTPKEYILRKAGPKFADQTKLLNTEPMGSGPWKFVKRVMGDHIEYEAVVGHWRATPKFKRLILMLIPEHSVQVSMLKAGEVDVISIAGDKKIELEKAGFKILGNPGAAVGTIVFYAPDYPAVVGKPIADPRVRRALSLAINRQEIIKFLLGGQGSFPLPFHVTRETADLDLAYWEKWSRENYRYDLTKAKDLLKEAGFANGFSIKLFSYPREAATWLPAMAQAVAGYWSRIGVKTEIVPTDYGTFRAMHRTPVNAALVGQAGVLGSGVRPVPWATIQNYFQSDGELQYLHNTEVDRLLNVCLQETDAAKRKKAIQQVVEIIANSWVTLNIAYSSDLLALSKKVGDFPLVRGWAGQGVSYEGATHARK
jgi:peptide/nickel transport system substrate-binding protein